MSAPVRGGHPCFDKLAHFRVGRLHLPVAPKCNVKCRYCRRAIGSSEKRPGVCEKIMSPEEGLHRVRAVLAADETIRVIGVAGPGDALANEATFETLALVHKEFPSLDKCVSTNGLLLTERLDDLLAVGVGSISVTINAVDESVGRHFYDSVVYHGKVYRQKAFELLLTKQLAGVKVAADQGMAVKINSILVPELNGDHLMDVAKIFSELGATLMNIMPLKPIGSMAEFIPPDCMELELVRAECETIIPQFRLCQQCRADAVGIPGRDKNDHLGTLPLFH